MVRPETVRLPMLLLHMVVLQKQTLLLLQMEMDQMVVQKQ